MFCSDNDFCHSLSAETRKKLCSGCRRRLLRAGSLEVFEQVVDKTFIILDGVCVSSMSDSQNRPAQSNLPLYSFCMPGRVLSQDILLGLQDNPEMPYISMDSLTDCCIATFEHAFVFEMYETDPAFARKVNESAVHIMFDLSKYAGIMRAEGAYAKTVFLMRHLLEHQLYLQNHHLADVLSCNRTTISRMVTRVKQELPDLWKAYRINKHRSIEILHPEFGLTN